VLEQRLNADATLRASSSRADGQSRLRVAVVRAGASELWSKEYALDGDTLPSLARTVAADAAAALRLRVRPGAPSAGHQASFTAYDAYQRGRALWEQRTPAALMRSLEFFKRAAELDPAYAEPWAGMADAYIALGVPAFGPLSPIEARRHSKDAALQALKIDPDLVEAHTSLAFAAYLHDWDWTAAEKGFKRALSLNPQYAVAHHWYADFLTALGRFAEADAEIRRALELEPLSIIIHRDVAWHLFFQRRYADAVSHLRETLRLDPAYVPARTLLGRALVEQGEYAEALRELNEAASGRPTPALESFVAYAQARAGNKRAAEEWLAGIRRAPNAVYVSPYYLGLVRLALGERGAALDEFERAYREQDTTIVNLKADPRLDPLRQEPRYQHLIEVLRFPAR
jgi:tetratricopeptide (TPR) repeat protein